MIKYIPSKSTKKSQDEHDQAWWNWI